MQKWGGNIIKKVRTSLVCYKRVVLVRRIISSTPASQSFLGIIKIDREDGKKR